MPGKTPIQLAYEKYRKQGMNALQAGKKARRLAKRLGMIKAKKELGLGSLEAFRQIGKIKRQVQVQRFFRKINPNFKVSRAEANDLNKIFSEWIISLPTQNIGRYSFADFLRHYAGIRFAKGGKKYRTKKEFAEMVLKALWKKLGKIKGKTRSFIYSAITISERKHPELHGAVLLESFFNRAEREGTLHKTLTQQNGLELMLRELAGTSPVFFDTISREIKGLRKEPSAQFFGRLRKNVHGFDSKPPAVRERIVQEARTTLLGEKIAKQLVFELESLERMKSKIAIQLGVSSREWGSLNWIIGCLKRPGNVKFLAQKAIEWYGRK